MACDRWLSIPPTPPPRGRPLIAAIAAALLAVNALGVWGAPAAASPADPTVPFREFVCRLIDGAAAANRLPTGFLARILWQESRLRNATSPAGAEGVAQFMPRTAAERGLVDPRDPVPAVAAAARLLADLRLQFGNLGFAAAAYNAGSGRVMKWLRNQSDLPSETHLYVVAVTGRPVEEWRFSAGALQISGRGGEPCLGVTSELAHFGPSLTSSPSWAVRLDRSLAQAVGVISMSPGRRRGPGLESLRASLALCDRIRLLGGRCAVFEP